MPCTFVKKKQQHLFVWIYPPSPIQMEIRYCHWWNEVTVKNVHWCTAAIHAHSNTDIFSHQIEFKICTVVGLTLAAELYNSFAVLKKGGDPLQINKNGEGRVILFRSGGRGRGGVPTLLPGILQITRFHPERNMDPW